MTVQFAAFAQGGRRATGSKGPAALQPTADRLQKSYQKESIRRYWASGETRCVERYDVRMLFYIVH